MKLGIKWFNIKDTVSNHKIKVLLCYIVIGLLIVSLFSGKVSITLETIVVSSDEQYIACFERGYGYKIRCFYLDGSEMFVYDVPSNVNAGGHCTLWFEGDVLLASFYRTNKIISFALDGTIISITKRKTEEIPSEFSGFSHRKQQYVYDGDKIDVVYNKGHFLGYWLFGEKRYLSIKPNGEDEKIIFSWTANKTG